jgi:hypothetical protein
MPGDKKKSAGTRRKQPAERRAGAPTKRACGDELSAGGLRRGASGYCSGPLFIVRAGFMAAGPPTAQVAGLVTAQSPRSIILAARRAITLPYSTGSSAQLKEEARAP